MPVYVKGKGHKFWHIAAGDRQKDLVPVLCDARIRPSAWAVPFVKSPVCDTCVAQQSRHEGIEPGDFVQIVEHIDLPLHLRQMLGRIGQVTGLYSVNYPPRITISSEPRDIAIVELRRKGQTGQTIIRKVPLVALERLYD